MEVTNLSVPNKSELVETSDVHIYIFQLRS